MKNAGKRRHVVSSSVLCLLWALAVPAAAPALDMDKLKVQRKEVFEFAEKPKVTREGDKVTIAFAAKDYCDATVAIENADGKIIRHLASGVLGKNAPPPFQKDSLKQMVIWDGKDEIGRYVDDKDSLTVRVSLGLKPQMERTLFWLGQKSAGGDTFVRAAPEGVYVWFAGYGHQLRLFDHEGNYLRTVYPIPASQIGKAQGLAWQEYPPNNERLPSKLGGHDQDDYADLDGVCDLAVQGGCIVLAGPRAVVLSPEGSGDHANLAGPVIDYDAQGDIAPGAERRTRPHSAALSPDGKRLYLTAYTRRRSTPGDYYNRSWHQHVNVLTLGADAKMTVFAGEMDQEGAGTDNGHFKCPTSVACDSQGRVYVADNFNSRIQVYLPDGRFYKSVPAERPSQVRVNPKTGELCVISGSVNLGTTTYRWMSSAEFGNRIENKPVPPRLTFLGPVDDPKLKMSYPLEENTLNAAGSDASPAGINVEVDFHTDPPTIWTVHAADRFGKPPFYRPLRLWKPEGRKLVLKRDFHAEAEKALARSKPSHFGRPRLWVNPATGLLYVGLLPGGPEKSFHEVLRIDPETGAIQAQKLPTDPEDMGFDYEGHAYLRTYDAVTRFDPSTWREIPYDYGEERQVFHTQVPPAWTATAAVTLPSILPGQWHMGGFGVSPGGNVVVSCENALSPADKQKLAEKKVTARTGGVKYTPPIYPGRNRGWQTHILDIHGKLVKADVAPGIGRSTALQIDRDNNVYLLAAGAPYLDGKPYFNGRGCTLIKLVPGKMKVLSAGNDPTAGGTPIPLPDASKPKRSPDMCRPVSWVEGAEWLFGPVGAEGHYGSGGHCSCYAIGGFALDYFGRSFAPEVDRFRVVVLDSNGNVMLRIGRYGNVDDGMPLVKEGGPEKPLSISGDETAIMHCQYVAVQSDRRLFLSDIGNQCIRSVKLGYHAEEKVALKDVKDLKP